MTKNTVTLGGRELPVGPANLKSIKRWLAAQKEHAMGSLEYMDELTTFIGATLRRSTPDVDQDWLDEHLDELTIPPTLRKIYEAGRLQQGEDAAQQGS